MENKEESNSLRLSDNEVEALKEIGGYMVDNKAIFQDPDSKKWRVASISDLNYFLFLKDGGKGEFSRNHFVNWCIGLKDGEFDTEEEAVRSVNPIEKEDSSPISVIEESDRDSNLSVFATNNFKKVGVLSPKTSNIIFFEGEESSEDRGKVKKIKEYIGMHVQFNKKVKEIECGFDPKMRAKIVNVTPYQDFWRFYFDFSFWEEYNKQFSEPTWYDGNGIACLKWHEVGSPIYPSDKIETVYLDNADCFDMIKDPLDKIPDDIHGYIIGGRVIYLDKNTQKWFSHKISSPREEFESGGDAVKSAISDYISKNG
jgi:hypothetical protein